MKEMGRKTTTTKNNETKTKTTTKNNETKTKTTIRQQIEHSVVAGGLGVVDCGGGMGSLWTQW